MKASQVIAQAPIDCPQVTLYARVIYGATRRYYLTGFAYGEDGAFTQRQKFAAREDQEEFDDKSLDAAMRNAGFHMPTPPIKVMGSLEYIYKLRPFTSESSGFNFHLHSRSDGLTEKRMKEEMFLTAFERQLIERAEAEAIDF